MGTYSGGRFVITAIESNKVFLEGWNNPALTEQITLPEALPANWPALVVGLQLLRTVHSARNGTKRHTWLPAKKQIKERFIPLNSTYKQGGRIRSGHLEPDPGHEMEEEL